MALTLPLAMAGALIAAPGLVPDAAAQARSGIYINNDVLNSLGAGPGAAPAAPLAPSPYAAPSQQPGYAQPLTPLSPPSQDGSTAGTGGLTFPTTGSGNFVVTRPGTLLFPPLHAPSSTLAPGFQHDNNAARTEALNNAFAGGPEPSSQLLIPLENPGSGSIDDGGAAVVIFEDQLPAREPQQAGAPVLRLRPIPPNPAPPKPAVPAEALARIQEAPAELAPEFRSSGPAAAVPPIADVEEKALAEAPAEPAPLSNNPASNSPVSDGPSDQSGFAVADEPAPVDEKPAAAVAEVPVPAPAPAAANTPANSAPISSAEVAPPVAKAKPPAEAAAAAPAPSSADAPVSLLPGNATAGSEPQAGSAPSGLQTASLTMDRGVEDMTFLFEVDSAELSTETQAELRSLADTLRGSGDNGIQVLGFASGQDGSEDQARKLALSRALKVRSFLIDAGIPSARIKVRSMGDRIEGGPANRVDIKPIGS
ncbi:MAG: OmpA family protein [Kiloniellaceae bacterium]